MSGSYLPTDGEEGAKQRTGSISVSLAGSDGRVFGGGVAGMLTAASPIQVVCLLNLTAIFLRGKAFKVLHSRAFSKSIYH